MKREEPRSHLKVLEVVLGKKKLFAHARGKLETRPIMKIFVLNLYTVTENILVVDKTEMHKYRRMTREDISRLLCFHLQLQYKL